jgi:hypothetical protein
MNKHVSAAFGSMVVLGLSVLALSLGCNRPLEVQKGDYLLHGTPEPETQTGPAPRSQPILPADPEYHPE